MAADIRLDSDIYTSDGEKIGTVDRIVVNPDEKTIDAIIAHQGFILTEDRIIEREFIERIDPDGTVHLEVTKDRVNDLPNYVEKKFVQPDQEDINFLHESTFVTGAYGAGRIIATDYPQRGVVRDSYPAPSSPMSAAPIDPEPVEEVSGIQQENITIDQGTDVIDRDGEKVGTVGEIFYSDAEEIDGFIVNQGLIFTHQVRVPIAWVESVSEDEIHLNRTAEQAEREGRIEETS